MADEELTAALAEIREHERKATPGPWKVRREGGSDMDGAPWSLPSVAGPDGQDILLGFVDQLVPDLRFAAEARADVPRLLGAVNETLKLAAEWEADAAEFDRDVTSERKSHYTSDHRQADTDEEIARTLREHAEALREAITSELTGKAADSG